MKKTRKIQLVLISAALASCNREFVPTKPVNSFEKDSTLTVAPVYEYNDSTDNCLVCCQYNQSLWNYSFNPFGYYYSGPFGQSYFSLGKTHRKNIRWLGSKLIVRGGWGKSAMSVSS